MKKSIQILLSICSFILLQGCQKSDQSSDIIVDDAMFESEEFSEDFNDQHNAANSLDYMGVYSGILPCADCEGIQTSIELGSGNSYVKKVIYLGKKDQQVYETGGTFTWSDDGNIITLNEEESPNQYFVGENTLFHLDKDGDRVEGELADKYRLLKQ